VRFRRSLPSFSPDGNCRLALGSGSGSGSAPCPVGTLLSYYGYRYLDTQLGRWLSRDPLGESGGVNLYRFVWNDGVNRADLFGLKDFNGAVLDGADDAREKTMNSEERGRGPESRREFCGLICKCNDEYKPTPAHAGPKPSMEMRVLNGRVTWYRTAPASCDPTFDYEKEEEVTCEKAFDEKWKMVGAYHSHPLDSNFSESDWEGWPKNGYPLGLVTPNGEVSILTPGGKIEIIRQTKK